MEAATAAGARVRSPTARNANLLAKRAGKATSQKPRPKATIGVVIGPDFFLVMDDADAQRYCTVGPPRCRSESIAANSRCANDRLWRCRARTPRDMCLAR